MFRPPPRLGHIFSIGLTFKSRRPPLDLSSPRFNFQKQSIMVTGSKVRVPDDDGAAPPPPPAVEDMPPLDMPPSDILLDEPVVDVEPALPAAGEDVPPLPIPGEDAASAGGVRRSTRSRGGTGGGGDAPPPPPAAAAEGAPPPHGHHVLQESYDQKWDAKYDELVAYHAEKGNANVPQSLGLLGRWVGRQREFYKKNALSVDRVARLVGSNDVMLHCRHRSSPRLIIDFILGPGETRDTLGAQEGPAVVGRAIRGAQGVQEDARQHKRADVGARTRVVGARPEDLHEEEQAGAGQSRQAGEFLFFLALVWN